MLQNSHQQHQSPAKYVEHYQLVFPRLETLTSRDYFGKCDAVVSSIMLPPYSMSKKFILKTLHGTAQFSEASVASTIHGSTFQTTVISRRWQSSCQDSLRHNEYALFLTIRTCSLSPLPFCQYLLSFSFGGNTENCTLLDYYSAISGSFHRRFGTTYRSHPQGSRIQKTDH